jgi:hypothetical protein
MAHPGGEAKRHCARRIILFRLIKFPHKFAAIRRSRAARQNYFMPANPLADAPSAVFAVN